VLYAPGVTIVIPARYAYITGDPSLLHVRLTIVGKEVFNGDSGFGDAASESTYLPALLGAHRPLLRELGVNGRDLRKRDLRKRLFRSLEQSVTFPGRVVEVIPVAIYD
jgi:hypothetical protein